MVLPKPFWPLSAYEVPTWQRSLPSGMHSGGKERRVFWENATFCQGLVVRWMDWSGSWVVQWVDQNCFLFFTSWLILLMNSVKLGHLTCHAMSWRQFSIIVELIIFKFSCRCTNIYFDTLMLISQTAFLSFRIISKFCKS